MLERLYELTALLLQQTVNLTLAAVEFAHKFRLHRYGPESKGKNVNAYNFRFLIYESESGRICKRSHIMSSYVWT
jgi:hypothetical protein